MAKGKLADYLRLMRVDKPAGTLLLLWPTLWGLWLAADGWPGWRWLFVFVAGVFVMRAFGCVANDLADRKLAPHVARTRERPLAAVISGFFAERAGKPVIPTAPRVRVVQTQQLRTALPWAARALGLPALDGPAAE